MSFLRASRTVTVVLAVLLAALAGYAVLANWQQAQRVRAVAAAGSDTDAYQKAAFALTTETTMLQGTMLEHDGEERDKLLDANLETQAAMDHMASIDEEHRGSAHELAEHHRNLQMVVIGFLAQVDRGDNGAAKATVEGVLEPEYTVMMRELLDEQNDHLADYERKQADSLRDSRNSVIAVIVVFLLGVVALGGLALSRRALRRQVEAMAATDPLTGLLNRTAFTTRAVQALATGRPTVLVINVDGFRDVNEQLGHRIGDLLLIEAARRLRSLVRTGDDVVARLGGDEFAVLLHDDDPRVGETIAERLTEAFDRSFVLDEVTVDLEVSIGAHTARDGEDVATVLRHADTAMHDAKQHRAGFHRFREEQRQDVAARLSLLGDLRRAMDDPGQLTLNYQPKVAVTDGALVGVEALARWHHPVRGPISPADFIPVLEVTNLMHRFTEHVLTIALRQARAWLDAGHRVPVAVNVSTRSLLDPEFPVRVAALLAETGVPGELLSIEVTEYALMSDPDTAIEALNRLRAAGVKSSIDDYGTGYSSMTYLKVLPIAELKIDRSFVLDIAENNSSRALVASTVELGHRLGLTVVAEGVEDEAAAEALREIGCDTAQGYHFARPLTADALTARLTDRELADTGPRG
ncbi:putative bifunctional diguanylate cyclase/phosphodiesterase [Paractinoplanes lichenicola]|uniref:Bifunctional diguanylate cyclase/phosphodiesterase n=1 Tax=Paractinoplanes lichenicola TaxID=2802976 RepID=A0ABS1VME7_9ACTN|nr:bifunctional diguanylate cyclase/phosphodiesterase [Actinoplanes lichenicola]MBL7255666.1 bifunctional diguanylate cyclase/phosphodiesterase [Actinoplanes lichenicola]